jgi:hypothetical protein
VKQEPEIEIALNEKAVAEIAQLQGEIRIRGKKIAELASMIYRRVRRSPVNDDTAIYMTYATAWTRFAGTVDQISTRTSTRTARALVQLSKAVEEPKPEKKAEESQWALSPMESLISMYVSGADEAAGTVIASKD